MARLYRVLVPVTDIEAAGQFYEAVLRTTGKRVFPGRQYFDCEGTILACFDPEADGDGYTAQPNPEPLYLVVSDLEARSPSTLPIHSATNFALSAANLSSPVDTPVGLCSW